MKPSKGIDIFCLFSRILIGGVLLYAGFLKAVAPTAEFAAAIDAYHLLPYRLSFAVATILPWVELWTGMYLVSGFFLRYAAMVATALFTVFVVGLGSSLARGLNLASCGCFGTERFTPRQTIQMDIVLLLLAAAISYFANNAMAWTLDALFAARTKRKI